MVSQEPWDIGAALPVSCTASGAAEQDLFTDRECNHTHTQAHRQPHFIFHLPSESVSQCLFFFTLFLFFGYIVLCGGDPEQLCL